MTERRNSLLLPAFGDADLPAEATAMLEAALTSCGAGSRAGELAEWLLEDPEDWPHWRQQGDGALVCDDRYSRRNPEAADSGYGDCTLFRLGLAERGLRYAVQVDPTATAHHGDAVPVTPPYTGRGRPPKPAYPDPPATFKDLVLAAGQASARQVTWRQGSRRTKTNPTAAMRSHFLRLRIRPANRDIPRNSDGTLPDVWLIAEWPPNAAEPVKYWLSNLGARTSLKALVRLAKLRWRVEHDYRELKTGLGIDHFEGRSFTGWHRHVTLTVLAQAFCTLLRLDPKADAPA
nr:transposase [Micromonospora sp. CB01531]